MDLENVFYLHNMVLVNNAESNSNSSLRSLKLALCGGLSGFMTRLLTQPLDVLKIRFQLQVEPLSIYTQKYRRMEPRVKEGGRNIGSGGFAANQQTKSSATYTQQMDLGESKYISLRQAGRTIYREEGFQGFWKGHTSGQLATISFMVVQFWSYERMMDELEQIEYFFTKPSLSRFICGGAAGCLGTLISMPFDVCRTREIGQDPKEKRHMYRTLTTVATEEGFRGLFRGLNTSLVQVVPLIGLNYVFYYNLNNFIKTHFHESGDKLNHLELLIAGGIAGVFSKFVLYPLDLIKKRIQLQGFVDKRQSFGRNHSCISVRDCMAVTYREEGFLGFYKGMFPTVIKSGLSTALYFAFYEIFTSLFNVEGMDRRSR